VEVFLMTTTIKRVPDPALMKEFCDLLTSVIIEACDVPRNDAQQIGADVLIRAESFASLRKDYADVLVVPFAEETFDHDPPDAPLLLKSAATFVIRNSALERYDASGQVADEVVRFLTTMGAGPLSHLIAARRRMSLVGAPSLFRGLDRRYPRAWASLAKVLETLAAGGPG